MNREDFVKELKNSNKFGEIESIFDRFVEFQDAAIDAFRFFHGVCKKYNIKYQVAFGSLLGAIRDNGQIPWDYDIDVIINYDDARKIEEAILLESKGKYYCISPFINSKYYLFMLRLSPANYHSECAHVDVFYSIGASDNKNERIKQNKYITYFFTNRHRKLMKISDLYPPLSLKTLIWFIGSKFKRFLISNKKEMMMIDSLSKQYPIASSDYCFIIYEGGYGGCLFKKSWLEETICINTSIGEQCVPKDYDEVLTRLYKNYKEYPDLDKRIEEILHYYRILEKFQSRFERRKK